MRLASLVADFDGLLMGLNIVNNVYEMIENFTGPVVEKIRGIVEDAKVGELRKLLETGEGEFGEKEKENLMIAGTGSISLGLYVLFQRSNGEEVNSDEVVKLLVAFVNFMEEYVGAVSAGVMSGVVKLIQNLRGEEEKVKVEEVEVKEEVVEAGELLNQTLKEEKEGLLKEVKEELEEFEWVKTEDE
ncbi:hypothetical protein TL16_g09545 [Triparma laevis f. inornata]|uniref:Uncharacterized protein n=1 Tax=Triparma laevis f. inornata TaxID=1714386 RepID=A0A9W7BAJ9_9STRA|nr:hypothetical protein TL16_g09545 [Triparma laevis f. inornata]